jgi:RNA polymerase sigma factor (sigma-70 family)
MPAESPRELDAITLRRAQRGEAAACQALVELYQHRVFALIGRLLGPRQATRVEDVAQETFLDVFRGLAGFAPLGPARLSTWILTIATRRAIDDVRRRAGETSRRAELPDDVIDPRAGVDQRTGLGRAIEAALHALPPDFRAVFVLREVHGLGHDEIARALALDATTVRTRLFRARAALRATLAAHEEAR